MISFDDVAKIFYMDWFIPLIIAYLVLGSFYLILKYVTPRLYNAKIIQLYCGVTIISLLIFYFIIPVNSNVQERFVNDIYIFKKNNKADLLQVKAELKKCNGYLNSYDFYKFKKAYKKDFMEVVYKNNIIYGKSLNDRYIKYKINKICEMEL